MMARCHLQLERRWYAVEEKRIGIESDDNLPLQSSVYESMDGMV